MNRLEQGKRAGILQSLNECMSQRACERIFKVSNKTVANRKQSALPRTIAPSTNGQR